MRGLYTLGRPYPNDRVEETARLLAVDPIAYGLRNLDDLRRARGLDVPDIHADHHHGDEDHGPNDGQMAVFYTENGLKVGQIELKLHDDKGDLELWLSGKGGFFDLPATASPKVVFVDREGKTVDLYVRNTERNEDEEDRPNMRGRNTNYFIFPGRTGEDASWLMGADFAASVKVTFSAAGQTFATEPFKLVPHTHGPAGHSHRNLAPDDPHIMEEVYHARANAIVDDLLDGKKTPDDFLQPDDLALLNASRSQPRRRPGPPAGAAPANPEKIMSLLVDAADNPANIDFIKGLRNDPEAPEKIGQWKINRMSPSGEDMCPLMDDPEVRELAGLFESDASRTKLFELLDQPGIEQTLETEQEKRKAARVERALNEQNQADFTLALGKAETPAELGAWKRPDLTRLIGNLGFYLNHTDLYVDLKLSDVPGAVDLANGLKDQDALKQVAAFKQQAEARIAELDQDDAEYLQAVKHVHGAMNALPRYADSLRNSTPAELAAVGQALAGGYVPPSSGGDPLVNPDSIPTGRNMYGINPRKMPTPESWRVGVRQAEALIAAKQEDTGEFPKKVAFSLWSSEFIRTEGVDIAQILYLLGAEPVRNARGIVHDVKLIPSEELNRPRIDVVVQTSGQFRDLAATRLYLIDRAVKLAAAAPSVEGRENHVARGVEAAEKRMKEKGVAPLEARNLATARIFGALNGGYGTGIMGMVEKGDAWETEQEIIERYTHNMGAIYTEANWSRYEKELLNAALQNTDTIVHGRSANTWGPLSLDHVYEFMGGLSAAIREATGRDPDGYFSDLRNPENPRLQNAKEAIWTETRSTLLNPKYIKDLQVGGASSAEVFAETFRNTFGWNVMKPNEIDNEIWD
ncbi:MAG: cobaltochelatase subunit CobN, partial [Verrucomicrobiota bacterium]